MAEDTRTRKLALSSLMASLSALFYLTTLLPVIQIIGVIFCPVPLTWVGFCYGPRFSSLATLTTMVLVFLLSGGPVQAYFFFSLFGSVALVTGYAVYRRYSPSKLILWGTLVMIIFNVMCYYGVEKTLKLQDVLADFSSQSQVMVKTIVPELYRNLPEKEISAIIALYNSWFERLIRFPLAVFTMASFATIYINYFVCCFVFFKLGKPLPLIEPVFLWRIHWGSLIPFLLVFYLRSVPFFNPGIYSDSVYFNLITIFFMLYFFLGFGVVNYFLFRYRAHWLIRLILLPLQFYYAHIVLMIGITDTFLNFRDLKEEIPPEKKYRKNYKKELP